MSVPPTAARGRIALLLGGCVAAIGLALVVADPSRSYRGDAELALLLRGMAAIKTLVVAAAVAAIAWRLGHPVTKRIARTYLVGAWLVTGATATIWQLSAIVPAAVLFHVGLLMLLFAAWRDEAPLRLRVARRRPRTDRTAHTGLATR